jgi:glycosyltransferase involved in cell wall biosynthesis
VGGIGEALVDGESGLLVPAGEARVLARALIDVLDDAPKRARMGAAAKARVERQFTRSAMIDGLLRVYEEALL